MSEWGMILFFTNNNNNFLFMRASGPTCPGRRRLWVMQGWPKRVSEPD